MKKFMTVLLVIAVMFTFSFSTAFAAEKTYYAADYVNALNAEKANQLSYLESAKNQVVNGYAYDATTGYYGNYTKEAYVAAADAIIAHAADAMDAAIRDLVNAVPTEGTTTAPTLNFDTIIVKINETETAVLADLKVVGATYGLAYAIPKYTTVLNKVQAPIVKAEVEAEIAKIDVTKYSEKEHATLTVGGEKVSAREYVEAVIATAKEAIVAGDAKTTDAEKITAYKNALSAFKGVNGMGNTALKTLEEEAAADKEAAKLVNGAVGAFLDYGVDFYNAKKFAKDDAANKLAAFYDATEKTVFGVKVAGAKVTAAEAAAINDAFYDAVVDAAEVVKAYADTVAEVEALYDGGEAEYITTLDKTMKVAAKYDLVVAEGEKMKKEYQFGVKTYIDAAVDEAVKEAKEDVYNLAATLKADENVREYIFGAAADHDITLRSANTAWDEFQAAIDKAQEKMYTAGVPTAKKTYGEDKTAEADLVYLQGTYATVESANWKTIADATVAELEEAQSYAEIETILANAAAKFDALMKRDVETKVTTAINKAKNDYANYLTYVDSNYDSTYDTSLYALYRDGVALIAAADTEAEVAAALAEAKALFAGIKTDKELEAMLDAAKAAIKALPYKPNLTVADKEAVKAAYDLYAAYKNASDDVTAYAELTILDEAIEKVLGLEREALAKEITALEKKVAALGNSDADLAAYVELKAEIESVVAAGTAFNKEIDAFQKYLASVTVADVAVATLDANLNKNDFTASVWNAEIEKVEIALWTAGKDTATVEEMKAAKAAFEALTDAQQYTFDDIVLSIVEIIDQKLAAVEEAEAEAQIAAVEGIKIKANSSAKKGSITVKWTVDEEVEGVKYQVYKSTKAQKGYKKAITTSKTSFKNTKNLTKGTRYYYKVRAIAEINGETYYSDWSNKANRIAK